MRLVQQKDADPGLLQRGRQIDRFMQPARGLFDRTHAIDYDPDVTGLVRAAHVFGLDHADLGSELVAVIEPARQDLTPDALGAALAERLPRYKQPRRIWRCRAMPVTPSGKVEAKTVRQWVAEENDALERFA